MWQAKDFTYTLNVAYTHSVHVRTWGKKGTKTNIELRTHFIEDPSW